MIERVVELIKYLVLSVIQGVGEVLPISSSGHLILFRKVLGFDYDGLGIELVLHFASLLALCIYYRKVIFKLIIGFCKYVFKKDKNNIKEFNIIKGMFFCLVPVFIVGYFFNDYLDLFFRYPFFIGLFLIFNAINLYLIKNKSGEKRVEELSAFSFFKIGLGQCMGLVPGFSRSGSSLSMCYRQGLNKEDSQTFTFLMLFPLVVGSIVLNMGDISFCKDQIILIIVSFIFTFILTFVCMSFLSKIVSKNKIHYFAYYCFVVGIILMFIG